MSRRTCKVVFVLVLLALVMGGCARVSVIPLDPKYYTAKPNAQEGVRYFLPKPYLLVMEVSVEIADINPNPPGGADQTVPKDKATNKRVKSRSADPGKSTDPGDGTTKGSDKTDQGSDQGGGSGTSPSPTSDTSFGMFTKQYGVKLIYLPDFEKPMAITQTPGLLGTASAKPSLTDGWMLTSLDASSDSKVSDTISAIASLVGSITGAGGGAATKGATTAAKAAITKGITAQHKETTIPNVLKPGLYRLNYDDNSGKLLGICAVTLFENGELKVPTSVENACR